MLLAEQLTEAHHLGSLRFMMRAIKCVLWTSICLCVVGCGNSDRSEADWEQLKIGDLAPSGTKSPSGAQRLKTINMGVHIFEVPVENIDQLEELWSSLSRNPLRFTNYNAFRANSFAAGFSHVRLWNKIHSVIGQAGGRKINTVSLIMQDGQSNDLTVARLQQNTGITFVGTDLSSQRVTVGPGVLALRIKVAKVPSQKRTCTAIAYPVVAMPTATSIPEIAAQEKKREFVFQAAAFGAKMRPGDLIVLGPQALRDSGTILGNSFFHNPQGSMFFSPDEDKPPQRKPAIRIFLLVCVRVND